MDSQPPNRVGQDDVFSRRRQKILEALYGSADKDIVYPDKSLKGSVDEPLQAFIDLVNQDKRFVSTSCCSGRIVVFISDSSGKKNLGRFLYCNHYLFTATHDPSKDCSPVSSDTCENTPSSTASFKKQPCCHSGTTCCHAVDSFFKMITAQYEQERDATVYGKRPKTPFPQVSSRSEVWLNVEPFVVHVECRDLAAASLILQSATQAGIKNYGLMGVPPQRLVFAARGSNVMRVPIGELTVDGLDLFVNTRYTSRLLDMANQKMQCNWNHIKRFEETFRLLSSKRPSSFPSPEHSSDLADMNEQTLTPVDLLYFRRSMPDRFAFQLSTAACASSRRFFALFAPTNSFPPSNVLILYHKATQMWITPHEGSFPIDTGGESYELLACTNHGEDVFLLVTLPRGSLPTTIFIFRVTDTPVVCISWHRLFIPNLPLNHAYSCLPRYNSYVGKRSGDQETICLYSTAEYTGSGGGCEPTGSWFLQLSTKRCKVEGWSKGPLIPPLATSVEKQRFTPEEDDTTPCVITKLWMHSGEVWKMRIQQTGEAAMLVTWLGISWMYQTSTKQWTSHNVDTSSLKTLFQHGVLTVLPFIADEQLALAFFSRTEKPIGCWVVDMASQQHDSVRWVPWDGSPWKGSSLNPSDLPVTVSLPSPQTTSVSCSSLWVPVRARQHVKPVKTILEAAKLFDRRRRVQCADKMCDPLTLNNVTADALLPVLLPIENAPHGLCVDEAGFLMPTSF